MKNFFMAWNKAHLDNKHFMHFKRTYSCSYNSLKCQLSHPDTHGQSIFHKGGKNIKWEKDGLFSKCCWQNWTAACKSMKLEQILTPCTKVNSKWLKNFNIRQDTIKILEEKTGKTFSDITCTNVVLGRSPKETEIKTKINKQNLIKGNH